MLVSQPDEGFRLPCAARQSVALVGDYHDCAKSPAGFDQPSLRRLWRASAGARVIGRATSRDFYALPAAKVVRLRRLPGIVETYLAQGFPSMEATTAATPRLPLLISAPKRSAA